MALTTYYVDLDIGGTSGAGTIGDPYSGIQHALDTATQDGSNGDEFLLKRGSTATLSGVLDFSTYGTPSQTAPCHIGAYGSGGLPYLNGGGGAFKIFGGTSHVYFRDVKMGNVTGSVATLTNYTGMSSCEIHDGVNGVDGMSNTSTVVFGCYFHDLSGAGASGNNGKVLHCQFRNGSSKKFTHAINITSGATIARNLITVDGTSNGIYGTGYYATIEHNSIYSDGGSGSGIYALQADYGIGPIANNIIAGFSASGGHGINIPGTGDVSHLYGNAVYDCDTEYSSSWDTDAILALDNETLSASPFVDAAGGDFTPANTGNVRSAQPSATGWTGFVAHNLVKGAFGVAAGGGGLLRHPGMTGGMVG